MQNKNLPWEEYGYFLEHFLRCQPYNSGGKNVESSLFSTSNFLLALVIMLYKVIPSNI